jgi:nicotinamidase/pyrazinamidase
MNDVSGSDALLVVDVQNDFCPGGALPVPTGHEVVEVINWLMPRFEHVIATQDVHPPDHSSFNEQGGPWPEHCVEGTKGAEFHPGLDLDRIDDIVQKGTARDTDGYSGFAGTDLADRLGKRGINRVFVTGLATDYCVKATALEAVEQGFDVVVITDAIAAVDVTEGDGKRALDEMVRAGATLETSDAINS